MGTKKAILLSILIIIAAFAGGFIVGSANDNNNENKPVDQLVVREYIEPYSGVGSAVYKHGTIVRLDENNQPQVIGQFNDETGKDHPGTWILRKHVNRD